MANVDALAIESEESISKEEVEEILVEPVLNARLFVEDLVQFIFKRFDYSCDFDNKIRNVLNVKSRFVPDIGEAVYDIISLHIHDISEVYRHLQKRGINEMVAFRRQLCVTAAYHLVGYDAEKYLVMVAGFVGVAMFYFLKGNDKMANATVQVLAYYLNYFISVDEFNELVDYYELCLAAQRLRSKLLASDAKSTFKLPNFYIENLLCLN